MPPVLNIFRTHHLRAFFASAVLLALLLRAFVPLGYMPDADALAKGIYKIVICTASGAQELSIADDNQPQKHPHMPSGKMAGAICSFSLNKLALGAPVLDVPVATPVAYVLAVPIPPVDVYTEKKHFENTGARAPPLA